MFFRFLTAAVIVCLVLSGSTLGQGLCGDINNSGNVTLSDLTPIIDHLAHGWGYDAFPHFDRGDVDGHIGITLGDAVEMSDFLFGDMQPLTCSPTLEYSFNPTQADTIYMPRISLIPDGVDRVILPVKVTLKENTDGFVLTGTNPKAPPDGAEKEAP